MGIGALRLIGGDGAAPGVTYAEAVRRLLILALGG
ncbi:DUF1515 family protein [Ensifer aridi]|nr:DUF1515 family protein [Ensifer aridi]